MFSCNFNYIFSAIIIISVEWSYGSSYCTDPSTYTCEDGYKPTYQQVRSSIGFICVGDGCDIHLKKDENYCSAAQRYCSETLFSRNSPVYSFDGTTGVRQCDSKERIAVSRLEDIAFFNTSCADGEKISAHNIHKFCLTVADSHQDEKLRSQELQRCKFYKKGSKAEEFKSRGDAYCEYVLLYCNSKHIEH